MRKWLSLVGLGLVTGCSQPANDNTTISLTDVVDPTYKVGQVWQYHTRPSEPNSTLTIVKIELASSDTIVHVHIADVKLKTDTVGTSYQNTIGHSPFSRAAITASVTKLVTVVQILPEYEEGYSLWRKAYLSGNGGIFSTPVSQSVGDTEETSLIGTKTTEAP